MDVKTLIAATPWIRRLWRRVPGPLKVPLLILAVVVAVWRWWRGRSSDEQPARDVGGEGRAPASAAA